MLKPHNGYVNRFQRIACQGFPNGDLLPLDLEDGESVAEAVKGHDTGDTMFNFVFIELGENGPDLSRQEALARIYHARDDIEAVIQAIEDAPDDDPA